MKTQLTYIFLFTVLALGACSFMHRPRVTADPVAENMLLYQRAVGGWPKHINDVRVDYNKQLSGDDKTSLLADKGRRDATIDNQATTKEIRYLVDAYAKYRKKEYLEAAENGIRYLLKMQYPTGGFPQFYPDSSSYRKYITYNDNAMINALNILWDVAHAAKGFDAVDKSLVSPAADAVQKGISCILQTQIRVNGKLTAWCAQYNNRTLAPANARAFELISISGSESVGVVQFLMKVENPSADIKTAIHAAMDWFARTKIEGFDYRDVEDASKPKGRDRILVADPSSVVWARFYDVETNKPFFTGRDGVKRWDLMEIEHERRIGYAWYGTWPEKLFRKEYPKWKTSNGE